MRAHNERMERKENTAKSQVSESTIEVYLNVSCRIHADVNKILSTEVKNISDKIQEKKSVNIPRIINLRF